MESFFFSINAIGPIVLMVSLGYFFKRIGLLPKSIVPTLNKVIFRVFLPAFLFLNIYELESFANLQLGYVLYSVIFILFVFFVSIPLVKKVTDKDERRGVLLQASFRSNHALIGVVLAQALFGEEGVVASSLLSAFIIPLFNSLAVLSLSIFRKENGNRIPLKKILLDIFKNPLIVSIALALFVLCIRAAFSSLGIGFRLSQVNIVFRCIQYLSNLSTPLALLVLGAGFEFSVVSKLKKEILFGTIMRTAAVPALGMGIAMLFFQNHFTGAQFAALVATLASPIAVSSVPMAQEMGGDVSLAGQLVVWTTITSSFTVFLTSFLLHFVGIF